MNAVSSGGQKRERPSAAGVIGGWKSLDGAEN